MPVNQLPRGRRGWQAANLGSDRRNGGLAQRDECSALWFSIIRMAGLRTSGKNVLDVLLILAPLSQKLMEPPANPGGSL